MHIDGRNEKTKSLYDNQKQKQTDFVHLHVYSDFSIGAGVSSVIELVSKARSLKMTHLAITDTGNMFGALSFYKECKFAGIHPIIGSEFYMRSVLSYADYDDKINRKAFPLVLLATSEEGYRNLIKLSSFSNIESKDRHPIISEELLEEYGKNLIGLSAGMNGEIGSLIIEGKKDAAETRARRFREILGDDNFYLELQDHGLFEEKVLNQALIKLSKRTGILLAATNNVRYAEPDDYIAVGIFYSPVLDMQQSLQARNFSGNCQFYLKSAKEMADLFTDYPEVLLNTVRIAERCEFDIAFPGPILPEVEIPDGFQNIDTYLRHLTYEGLKSRYRGTFEEVRIRADYELDVIIGGNYTAYFLIVADYVAWARMHDIPVGPGRGSAASSIVAYALQITDIDPLRFNLAFELFINPNLTIWPDIAVDFCYERRDEVVNYVAAKYGKDRVGHIVTFRSLKGKTLIENVAKTLDYLDDEAGKLASVLPDYMRSPLRIAMDEDPQLKKLAETMKYAKLFAIADKLEGKNSHVELHSAAIAIGKKELHNYTPIFKEPNTGCIATQFASHEIEECGLVQIDFLGFKVLTFIKKVQDMIRNRGGRWKDFNADTVPLDDESTFRMLCEGESDGVFQFESQGLKNILKTAKPNTIEDLIVLSALYRPSTIDYIPQFIETKLGRQIVEYPAPCFESICKETYGIIVYQEQLLQIIQKVAGYSPAQSDILRRIIGKKETNTLAIEKEIFIERAIRNGFTEQDADQVFQLLVLYSGYAFSKSHATAYTIISWQCAYLKANFPEEFARVWHYNQSREIS